MTGGVTNIVVAGVGGQGSVLSTLLIARAAHLAGHGVATSEVHGMAQRGGIVTTTVRFGDGLYGPAVPEGDAHFLVAFERLEGLRHLPWLRPDGFAIVNDQRITPGAEGLKRAPYPENVSELIAAYGTAALMVPGLKIASELGNPRLSGSVVLGVLSTFLPFPDAAWEEAIARTVPPKTTAANQDAFQRGVGWSAEQALASA
jgi:indolepyruvate ferredoxin oxidoreductase, beta subunit